MPDSNDYNTADAKDKIKLAPSGVGSLKFEMRPERNTSQELVRYCASDSYDADALDRGFSLTCRKKPAKGNIIMRNQSVRDSSMYNFDKDYLKNVHK